MSKPQTVPLICGAVYEKLDPKTQLPERVAVFATKRLVGGRLVGLARDFDGANELEFTEGDENMLGWSLVAKPVELEEPISAGNIVETENATLKKQLQAAKNRVTELERAEKKSQLTDESLVELAAQGTTWSSIGRPFDMGWREVKNRFDALVAAGQKADATPAAKKAAVYARQAAKAKKDGSTSVQAPTETKAPAGATA